MRSYSVAVSTLAIDAPPKWTDNLLHQFQIEDIPLGRQGVARRITYTTLVRLTVIRQLHVGLGIGVGDAVRLTEQLLDSRHARVLEVGQLRLTLDLDALRRALDQQLAAALESAPSPRRGRPPRK